MHKESQTPLLEVSTENDRIIEIDLSKVKTTSPLPVRPVSLKESYAQNIALALLSAFTIIMLAVILKVSNEDKLLELWKNTLQLVMPAVILITGYYFGQNGQNRRQSGGR